MPQGTPCNFSDVKPGTGTSNPCSPQVDADFRGLRINAPAEVFFGPGTSDPFFGGFAKLIVAGICKLGYSTLGLRGEWPRFVVIIATDTRNKQVFAGTMKPFGSPAPLTDPLKGENVTADDFAGVTAGRWFNPNIILDLDLPEREAGYDIYAVLGPYKSNVVHTKVSRKK
jgi:hypothetical protein